MPSSSSSMRNSVLACLRSSLPPGDDVLTPSDKLYSDASRPYNARFQGFVHPLMIIYPSSRSSISSILACTTVHNLAIAPRSGGHSYGAYSLGAGMSTDSVVIDMRKFSEVVVDDQDGTVRVGSGVLLGELAHELERHGRVMPHGSCPTVGVGGQALAGGFGLMSRKLGLLLDTMISIDVVLANGTHVTTSLSSHADLFWAMRGSGSSLSIATSFVFQTSPLPPSQIYFELVSGILLPTSEDIAKAVSVFESFQEYGRVDAPPEIGFSFHLAPEGKGVKTEVLGLWNGPEEGFEAGIGGLERRFREKGVTFRRDSRRLTYLESLHNTGGNWTKLEDRGPWGSNEFVNFYASSPITYQPYSSPRLHNFFAHMFTLPPTSLDWFVLAPFLGGKHSAIAKVGRDETAFAHRDVMIAWEFYAKIMEGSNDRWPEGGIDFVQGMASSLVGKTEGVYPAYVDPELPLLEHHQLLFKDHYPRLQEIKTRYDPENIFRSPQSIAPLLGPSSKHLQSQVLMYGLGLLLLSLLGRRIVRCINWGGKRVEPVLPSAFGDWNGKRRKD